MVEIRKSHTHFCPYYLFTVNKYSVSLFLGINTILNVRQVQSCYNTLHVKVVKLLRIRIHLHLSSIYL